MTAHPVLLVIVVVGSLACCPCGASQMHVLEDFEAGLTTNWKTWGKHGGKVEVVKSPDGEGKCLLWSFDRPADAKEPSGLVWQEIKLPTEVTQALNWALEFSIRGASSAEGGLSVTLNEADRSCWRTPKTANVEWEQIQWQQMRIPVATLAYAWGNDQRAGTTFDLRQLKSITLALKGGIRGAVYLDDFRLVGRAGMGVLMGAMLPMDFTAPPLNRFGHEESLPSGQPPPAAPPRPAAGSPSRVELRADGVALLNGKPFLPLGVFCVPQDCFAEIAAAGFNTVLNYGGAEGKRAQDYLDSCAQHGLMAVVDAQSFTRHAKSGRLEADGLSQFVQRVKGHPALLAYYLADEPEYGQVPVEEYVKGYQLIKQADPDHPVIMLNNGFSAISQYAAAADLLMPDPYPNFYQVDGPMRSLVSQGAFVRECQRVKPNRAWFTPQFHNGACYGQLEGQRERGDVVGRAPTLHEVRFEVYSALVHGARGIIAWPFEAAGWGARDAPEYLRGLKALMAELAAFTPALLSTDAQPLPLSGPVKAIACRHDGQLTVVAINDSGKPARTTLPMAQAPAQVHVVSEKRVVDVTDGAISDAFEPWAVHVYTTQPSLAQTALADLLVGYVEAYSLAGTVHPTRDSNLALYLHGSRASASSTNRYARANAAINGSYATLWRPEKPGDEHWIAVDFQRRVTLGRVLLVTSAQASGEPLYPAEAWRVETKAGETWEPVEAKRSHFFIHWNPQLTRWERSTQPSAPPRRAEEYRFPPRPVTSLRFVLKQPKTSPSVYEVEAYAQ